MRRIWVAGLSTVAAGILFSGATAWAAPAVTLECGQTVTTSVKLGNDLLNCPEDGIVVGASNITVDLNGHRITGPVNFDPEACSCGVNDRAGFDHITLRSGRIKGFWDAARFDDAEGVTVRNLVTSGHYENGIRLVRAPGSRVAGSSFSAAYRGIEVEESSNALIDHVHLGGVEHSALALFNDTDSTVRNVTIAGPGGEWGIELGNSSRILVEHNLIRAFGGIGIGVIGEKGRPTLPGEEAIGNTIEHNVVGEGVTGLELGIALAEYDGGIVRQTTVAHNAVRGATELGVVVAGVASSDGHGNPPFEELTGVGPSQNLLESNRVLSSGEDGIRLSAPGNVVTTNDANRNAEWGIYAVEGNADGGGNTARHNGQPAQCSGVVCNGQATALSVHRRLSSATRRFKGVQGNRHHRG